jgi:hypothetical protein
MEIEIKIKDTVNNLQIFKTTTLEMYKYLLENEPKVLLNEIIQLEKGFKNTGAPNLNAEPTPLFHITA